MLFNIKKFCAGNIGSVTIKYSHTAVVKPITVGVHDYKIIPTIVAGTFSVQFTPFLDAKDVTVIVDTPANPKVDYKIHLSIMACFEPEGS